MVRVWARGAQRAPRSQKGVLSALIEKGPWVEVYVSEGAGAGFAPTITDAPAIN